MGRGEEGERGGVILVGGERGDQWGERKKVYGRGGMGRRGGSKKGGICRGGKEGWMGGGKDGRQ